MNKKFLALSSTAVAAAIALAGCSPSGSPSGGTTDHGAHGGTSASPSGSAPAAGEHNAADVMFAQMMIPHHAQAVSMSDIVLAKADLPASVKGLAQRIKAAQAPEIEKMTGWLKAWNQPTAMSGSHGMAGMMSDEDLDKLKAAQGTEAARLFLTQMITHHEGAITMARSEESGGKYPDAVALAKDIIKAQQAEIEEMKQLLQTL